MIRSLNIRLGRRRVITEKRRVNMRCVRCRHGMHYLVRVGCWFCFTCGYGIPVRQSY